MKITPENTISAKMTPEQKERLMTSILNSDIISRGKPLAQWPTTTEIDHPKSYKPDLITTEINRPKSYKPPRNEQAKGNPKQ